MRSAYTYFLIKNYVNILESIYLIFYDGKISQ